MDQPDEGVGHKAISHSHFDMKERSLQLGPVFRNHLNLLLDHPELR
jgi:hypothetical protein